MGFYIEREYKERPLGEKRGDIEFAVFKKDNKHNKKNSFNKSH